MKTRLYEKLTAKLIDRYGSNIHTAFADILEISKDEAVAISKNLRFKQYLNMSNALASGDVNTARALATEAKENYELTEQPFRNASSNHQGAASNTKNPAALGAIGQYPTAATTGKQVPQVGLTATQKRHLADLQQQRQVAQQSKSMAAAPPPSSPTASPQPDMAKKQPPKVNVRPGQTAGAVLSDFKAKMKSGDTQAEFTDGETSFYVDQNVFVDKEDMQAEDLKRLKRLSGI